MADRTLSLSLTCEKYSDLSAYAIAYSEERSDPELVEQFSPEGSGVTRTFYCAWADRFNFIENMMGFAKVVEPTGLIPADGFGGGWNGRHIHRKFPVGYHMGLTDTATPPAPTNWVYAVRAVSMPDGAKANEAVGTSMSVYEPKATYAKILVTFAALDYDVEITDLAAYNGGGSAGAGTFGCCREWLRYSRIVQKPAHIFFQYPSQALQMVDNPSAGLKKPLAFQPNVLDNVLDFWVYAYDLPYDPIIGVNQCFGKLNKFVAFPTPDAPGGQYPETLQLVAANIVRLPLRNSRRYWNLELGFRKVFNVARDGAQVTSAFGHNYVRDTVDAVVNGVPCKQLEFFYVSANGLNQTTPGNPMIDVVDYSKLWWITL